jgi:integrase
VQAVFGAAQVLNRHKVGVIQSGQKTGLGQVTLRLLAGRPVECAACLRFTPATSSWQVVQPFPKPPQVRMAQARFATGKVRVILLPPAVVELCKVLAERYPSGPLFRNTKGRPLSPDRLRNWLFKTRRRLGLGRVIAYGFRHGLAADALANGVPDAQVAELLGHSGTAMLQRHHAHLGAKALREALGRIR